MLEYSLFKNASHWSNQGEFTTVLSVCLLSNVVLFITGSTVFFSQSNYSANEKNGKVQPVLELSSIVSIEFTVTVTSNDDTAKGEQAYNYYHFNT